MPIESSASFIAELTRAHSILPPVHGASVSYADAFAELSIRTLHSTARAPIFVSHLPGCDRQFPRLLRRTDSQSSALSTLHSSRHSVHSKGSSSITSQAHLSGIVVGEELTRSARNRSTSPIRCADPPESSPYVSYNGRKGKLTPVFHLLLPWPRVEVRPDEPKLNV